MTDRRCRVCGGLVPPDAPGHTFGHETAVGLACIACLDRRRWAVLEEQEAANPVVPGVAEETT